MNLPLITNIVQLIGFGVAFAFALALPVRAGGRVSRGIKGMIAGMMAIFLFVALSHVLQYANITKSLDTYENYVKVMFFPLAACTIYALRLNEQLRETRQHAVILSAEHDMLMRVVDTTPNGLLVLDQTGRIEFANEKAKDVLDIEEDPDTGGIRPPAWLCSCDPSGEPGVMSCCFIDGPLRDYRCSIDWPNGWRQTLTMNATPIVASDGSAVGAVVAFTAEDSAATA